MKINLSFIFSFLLLFTIFIACSNQQLSTENLAKTEQKTLENIEKNEELEKEISNEIESNFNENIDLIDNELLPNEVNNHDSSEINSYFSEIESDFSEDITIEEMPLI
ncbi:MAG: hypothetical protein QXR30_00385 [Candidatus Woesearchaeota archaeon]